VLNRVMAKWNFQQPLLQSLVSHQNQGFHKNVKQHNCFQNW